MECQMGGRKTKEIQKSVTWQISRRCGFFWWFYFSSFFDASMTGIKKALRGEEKHVNRILKRNQQKLWSRMSKLFPISSFSPFLGFSLMEWWMVNRANLCVTHRKTIKINKTTNQAIRLSVALISTSFVISSNQDPKSDPRLMIGCYERESPRSKSTKITISLIVVFQEPSKSYWDFLTPLSTGINSPSSENEDGEMDSNNQNDDLCSARGLNSHSVVLGYLISNFYFCLCVWSTSYGKHPLKRGWLEVTLLKYV